MMEAQCVDVGASHRSDSNTVANTVMTTAVVTVIQKDKVRVGNGMVVLLRSCVPKAQELAAPSAKRTPKGLPEKLSSSCHSKKITPMAAALIPPQLRFDNWVLKTSAPMTAEKMGMV